MAFCNHCGKEILDSAVVCVHCGCSVAPNGNANATPNQSTEPKKTKYCRQCGSASVENAVVCVHCGCAVEEHVYGKQDKKPANVLSILGFIFAFIVPLAGLILSCISLKQIKKDANLGGKGLATAGLILSIVFMALNLLDLIALLFETFGSGVLV